MTTTRLNEIHLTYIICSMAVIYNMRMNETNMINSESNKRWKIIEWKTLRHSESTKKASNTHKKLMKSKWVLRSVVNNKDTLNIFLHNLLVRLVHTQIRKTFTIHKKATKTLQLLYTLNYWYPRYSPDRRKTLYTLLGGMKDVIISSCVIPTN